MSKLGLQICNYDQSEVLPKKMCELCNYEPKRMNVTGLTKTPNQDEKDICHWWLTE